MNISESHYCRFLAVVIILSLTGTYSSLQAQTIKKLVPGPGEVFGWNPGDSPRFASGDDLFLLINGGADIYLEYGFKETIFQSFSNIGGKIINLEIYKMESPGSAFGMYTFKTGNNGEELNIGQDGWKESYYLNFWQGNFLVTLIGMDSNKDTMEGLVAIAKAVSSKIKSSGSRPEILNYLPEDGLINNGILYFKGNLGFYNQYLFDSKNIFGVTEGVMGTYTNHRLFILKYKSNEEASKWYDSAMKELESGQSFTNFKNENHRTIFFDKKNVQFWITPYKETIIILMGNHSEEADKILNIVQNQMDKI